MLPPIYQSFREIDTPDRDKIGVWRGILPHVYSLGTVTAIAAVIYQLPTPDKDERQ